MENIVLSIILPIYNVEKYLRQCIKSVYKTDRSEKYEILLIDDGSTDSSGKIADDYANEYENIIVYHKINGGLSDARNYGLSRSKGKYVFFLDSDDYLANNALDIILQYANDNGNDIILWNGVIVNEQGVPVTTTNYEFNHPGVRANEVYNASDFILEQLKTSNDYVTTVWLGMYKREFLIINDLWFKKGILHEDELWSPIVFLKSKGILLIDEKLYCYRIRKDSIMNKQDKDYSRNLRDSIYIFNSLINKYEYLIDDLELLRGLKANNSKRYLHAITKYEAYRYNSISNNIKRFEIFTNARGFKDKLRSIVLLINLRLYCYLSKIK